MRVNILKLAIAFVFLTACENKKSEQNKDKDYFKINLEKIVVINLDEVCVTYFKVEVENKNDSTIVLIDNNLKEIRLKGLKPQKKGFYLRNIQNDSILPLGIDNYYFYEIGAKRKGYCFIAAVDLKKSWEQKDSLEFRKSLANYTLEYNGAKLDLNKIVKTDYISQKEFDEFKKNKNSFIPFKDSLSVSVPKNIPFKYLSEMPITREEWDAL